MIQTAIIGAGIAGLGTALFARQRGLSIPIYEKETSLCCQDNLLWIAPNGMQMLAALGLAERVLALAVPQDSMLFSSRMLKPVMGLDGEKLCKSNGFKIMAIKRRDLYQTMLTMLLEQGGDVNFGHRLCDVALSGNKVLLKFEGVATTLEVDLILAADGIGSLVRRTMFPQSSVKFQGLTTYLGSSPTKISQKFVGQTIETWGVGTRFVLTSLDGQTTYWSAIERPTRYEKNSAPLAEDLLPRLGRLFEDYHPDLKEVLRAANPQSLHRCNFGVVTGVESFYRNQTILLGDAAHGMPPNMGQGASLALEDGCYLVDLLARNLDPSTIGGLYDHERRPRVKQMMGLANTMNWAFQPKSRAASWVRDVVAGAIPTSLNQKRMAQLYRVPFNVNPPLNSNHQWNIER